MLKRTPLNRIGKVGRANLDANKILRDKFAAERIVRCEIALSNCLYTWTLAFAHRHKRDWYKGDVAKLSDFNQVVLACVKCHDLIEHNAELTKEVFQRLRGTEE